MKKLSVSDLELVLDEAGIHQSDVSLISNEISRLIQEHYEGDRRLRKNL
jgi:hypothetical protein